MSVARLTGLVETGRYRECLQEAARLLAAGIHGPAETARIYACQCRSALELSEYEAAAEAGARAEPLARRTGEADLLGAVFLDVGTALWKLGRHEPALLAFRRYQAGLETYTAARCLEGTALLRMARVSGEAGKLAEATELYRSARGWFERFGDTESSRSCSKALAEALLKAGRPEEARAELSLTTPEPGAALTEWCDYLLDWAACHLAAALPVPASQAAFAALEMAEGDLPRQSRAQILLSRSAALRGRDLEAFLFALASRISAIDGRLYAAEFEATQVMIELLRTGGRPLLLEAQGELARQGVDLYDYLPKEVLTAATQ